MSGPGAAAEEAALLGLAPVAPDATLAYGPHPDQVIDLYGQRNAGPVVLLLHGGFWRAAYDRTHLSPLAAELARHGLPVALAEYRRSGAGGGWPHTYEDVVAATAALERPVVAVGHSAGGHLALLLAAARPDHPDRPDRPGPDAPRRIIVVAPVADLAHAHELGLSDRAVAEFLGTGPGWADRLTAADPVRRLPCTVPVTVLHGTADPDVPIGLSRRYVRAAEAAGGTAPHLRELAGTGHYAPVTPGTAAFRVLLDTLRST
ncbi:lipase [Streptomyces chrestomyceticus JCM 4735]|uniref:Lipase n=1 Tax=Streptomyces chrestomyceticus JCM 4735 TaxID=1306181 RepID=A0A7U9PXN3_9ACTN|nr:alpha/beta hydrolase [Streptomyces chrestomyceticus]GCD36562.1 lipase [Streptomyces chrestomyceticus JCM 4735]